MGARNRTQLIWTFQIQPKGRSQEYLVWLADRIKTEKPFIGYHASCALLIATDTLHSSHANEIQNAITRAQANLNSLDWKDPNQVSVLRQAELALKKK